MNAQFWNMNEREINFGEPYIGTLSESGFSNIYIYIISYAQEANTLYQWTSCFPLFWKC